MGLSCTVSETNSDFGQKMHIIPTPKFLGATHWNL